MTVAELLDRISAEELEEWRVFDERFERIGDRRADWRAGVIAATIANVAPVPEGTKREALTPEDFAFRYEEAGTAGTPQALSSRHAAQFAALEAMTKEGA